MNYSGNTVLITGGNAGIGLEMTRAFHAKGWTTIICGRNQVTLDSASQEMPGLTTIQCDVSVEADRDHLFEEVAAKFGSVDVFINNAAINKAHDYADPFTLSSDHARDEIDINYIAPIELTRKWLKLRADSGHAKDSSGLVMINTPGSLIPLEANIMYCSTKAGLHMFTLILRRQLRESGVRVMEVFPPGLETGLARDLAVPSQGQKPESALRDTSVAIVDSILNGEEVILPHRESEFLYNNFAPKLDPDLIDKMNLGVQRRPGWNA